MENTTRKVAAWLMLLALLTLSGTSSLWAKTKDELGMRNDRGVTFNFVDVELPVIAKFVSEITHKNFILDERVKGKITIIAPVKLSTDDTFDLFKAVLEMKGFTFIPSGVNAYSIIPVTEAKQKGLKFEKSGEAVSGGYAAQIFTLKYISAEEVFKLVQPIISKDGYASSLKQGNLLLVMDSADNISNIQSIISIIDKQSEAKGMVNIYFLENADATDLAKVLETVFKTSQSQRQNSSGAFEQVGAISVTADKASNSLVITASPSDYQNLLDVIKKLDKRRRQVFVQAVIAEVNLTKLKDLGNQLTVAGGDTSSSGKVAGAGVFDPFSFLSSTTTAQQSTVISALTTLAAPLSIGTNIHALFSSSATNVLSTPTIMTSDNMPAEIFVGENVPFVSSSSITTTTTTQSVERKDTGIILRITPQITEGDYLKLDIYQEISAVKDPNNKGAAADITTTKRSAKTSVVVKDKDTVVIGGLIQEQEVTSENKIPLFGDVPLLGWLFKYKTKQLDKINLMITLTPHIVKTTQDMKEITEKQGTNFNKESKTNKTFNLEE